MESEREKTERIGMNIARIEELNSRLLATISQKPIPSPGLSQPNQELFAKAGMAYMREMFTNPAKVFEQQVSYWASSMKLWAELQETLAVSEDSGDDSEVEKDRRFQSELWRKHPYFNLIKQQYKLNSELINKSVEQLDGLDDKERRRVAFFAQQLTDMLSPANFLATNPEALERAVQTDGQSLVDGLENLVSDLEKNDGELLVSLSDPSAFKVGENLASTNGSVVFRNDLFELIQYGSTTEQVKNLPLLIVPPWINKYYILDLKPKNSLIKWIVDQGYTVFVMSWVNPDERHRSVGMDTYAFDGCYTAVSEVKKIVGVDSINAVGYCIGGTLLSMVLAHMSRKKDKSVRCATFFTTLADFEDTGELSVYLSDDFIDGIGEEVEQKGYFPSVYMSRAFSYMRANDLVYGPAVKSYLLGEPPPAFDLLYWNGDSTNLPARMTKEYLEEICCENAFAKGTYKLNGTTVSLKDVKHPFMAIACESDHLVSWRSSYEGMAKTGSRQKTFILAESGHIAGIINPPTKKKYGHYTSVGFPKTPDSWKESSELHAGTWWPTWEEWLRRRSGKAVPARDVGGPDHPRLADAPGTYVHQQPAR